MPEPTRGGVRTQIPFPIQLYRQLPGLDPLGKPGAAANAASASKRKLIVPHAAAIQPRGGIAETLAAILPPAAVAGSDITGRERAFSPLRRPAQLAARARLPFTLHQALVGAARRVSQSNPNEVKQLVDEDARKLLPAATERHAAFPHKCSGIDRAPGPRGHPAQGVRALDADGSARNRRQTAQHHPHLLPAGGVLEQEKARNRHSPRVQERRRQEDPQRAGAPRRARTRSACCSSACALGRLSTARCTSGSAWNAARSAVFLSKARKYSS